MKNKELLHLEILKAGLHNGGPTSSTSYPSRYCKYFHPLSPTCVGVELTQFNLRSVSLFFLKPIRFKILLLLLLLFPFTDIIREVNTSVKFNVAKKKKKKCTSFKPLFHRKMNKNGWLFSALITNQTCEWWNLVQTDPSEHNRLIKIYHK